MTPSLDDDDVTIVRWHECEKRPVVLWREGADVYLCAWDDHHHAGTLGRRRGSGRRIAQARWHLRKHLEAKDAA